MKFLNWLKNKLDVCNHEWVDIDKYEVNVYNDFFEFSNYPIKTKITIVQRCKKCGKINTYKFNV